MATASKRDLASKIGSAFGDAGHIAILLEWIENARQLISQLETLDRNNKDFEAICKSNEIAVFAATWEAEQSDALTRLLGIQRQILNAGHDAAQGSAS